MKPYYLMMAAMSAIVFMFGIPGTADYFLSRRTDYFTSVTTTTAPFFETVKSGETDAKLGLWRFKTFRVDNDGKEIDGTKDSFKITDDTRLPCKGFRQHIQAASAFAILTVIFSVVALAGFALNIIGNEAPIGFAGGAGTIVMGMITWALMAAIRNRPHCKGETTEIHLDNTDNGAVAFKYYHGFYFFLVPWVLYVITFIVAIIMKAGDKDGSASSDNEPTSKSRDLESASAAKKEKKEKKVDERSEEEKAADAKEKEERAKAAKATEEKRREEEKARAEEEERLAKEEAEEMAAELNSKDVERRKKIWADLKERLPTDKKDKDQRRRRFELFELFDTKNKKYLTPEDLAVGCKKELGLGQLHKGLGYILPKAHAMARGVHQAQGKSKKEKEENIERCEFRLVLCFIKELFDLWFKFDEINIDNNGHISRDEFDKGSEQLKSWGLENTGDAAWNEADAGKNGHITFSDFCDWARRTSNASHSEGDDTDNDETAESVAADEQARLNREDVARRRKIWDGLKDNLPTNKKSKEERARRFQYFAEFDTANKGYLTLADVEEGCATVLGLGQLGKGLKHILPLANNSARGLGNVKGQTINDQDHVEKTEMRMLFVYIHQYFDLWFIFDGLDSDNTGEIDFDEFSLGIPELEKWGDFKIEDPKKEFRLADSDSNGSSGAISFIEFVEWAHSKNDKDE